VKKRETLGDRVAQLMRVKAAHERRDISQKEVAAEIGVSRPVISETVSGKTYPSPETRAKLARYFNVSEMFLEYGVELPASQGKEMTGFEAQTAKPAKKRGKSA